MAGPVCWLPWWGWRARPYRFSTVHMADHIVVIDDGTIAEQGTHEELMARNGTYAGLYRLQASAYTVEPDLP